MPLDEIPTPTIQTKQQLLDRLKGGTAEILLYRDLVETLFSFINMTVEATDLNVVMNPLFKGYDVEPIWTGVGTGEARVGWSVFPFETDAINLERKWASGKGVAYTSGVGGFPRWRRTATTAADEFLQQRPWITPTAGWTYDISYIVQEEGTPASFLRFEYVNNSAGAGVVAGTNRTAAGTYSESLVWGASNTTIRFRFDKDCINLAVKGPIRMVPQKHHLVSQTGKRWIVHSDDATGAWAGRAGMIAIAMGNHWDFFAPFDGMIVWVREEKRQWRYSTIDGWKALDPAGVPDPRKYFESVYPTTTMFTTKTDKFTLSSDGSPPPYDILTPNSYYSDPDAVTIRRGTFIIEPRGGSPDDSRFPRFFVNDSWWEDSTAFGVNPIDNSGSPRAGVDGGLDIYSDDTIDTTEIRGGTGQKDAFGRIINWADGAQQGIFRLYPDTLGRQVTSGRVVWEGRPGEILFENRPTEGFVFRVIGIAIGRPRTERRDLFKIEPDPSYGPPVSGAGFTHMFFKLYGDDWRQIEMKIGNALPGASYSFLVVQNT